MTGVAGLAGRDVPMVNTAESTAESQPNAQDAPPQSEEAFASILARAGDGPARSPTPSLAGSRIVSARFQGGMRLPASSLEDQPDPKSMHQGAPSSDLDEASSGDIAATGSVRHKVKPKASPEDTGPDGIGAASGQRPHPVLRGTEDSEVDPASEDRDLEIAAPDVGRGAPTVGLYVSEPPPLEASRSEAPDNTSGAGVLHGLAHGSAEHGPHATNDSVSEVALQPHAAGVEAIDRTTPSSTPTDRTDTGAETSGVASEPYDAGFDAIDRGAPPSAPIAARMESGDTEREQSPEPAIQSGRKPEPGSVAVGAAAMEPPIRPLVTGRETHFAPARPIGLDPFTGKSAPAEIKSQMKAQTEKAEAPPHAPVEPSFRGHRSAPTVPSVEAHVPADGRDRSPFENDRRVAPAPSASDRRIGPTQGVSDDPPPPGLPAGQLQRIADVVLASAAGKPDPSSLDPAPNGKGTPSQSLADGAVRTLVIKLDPPDYGTLTIRIRLSGKAMAVQFHAARSETARLLSDDRDKLSAAIETAGHEVDISIVGAAPNPTLPGSSTDQSWLSGSAGGATGSQLANPENERRPASPPAHPFGDDRQFPRKDRDRDSHETNAQDRRSGSLYV